MPAPNAAYRPAPDSLAAQVGAYLKTAGAGALLTAADVARRFQVPSSSVQASLDPAVRAQFLNRNLVNGAAHYAAGKLLASWQPAPTEPRAAAPTAAPLAPRSAAKRPMTRLEDLPDPSTLVIRTDVPVPAPRTANITGVFEPVYLELEPGHSFPVPIDKQKVFQRMGVELGRKHGRRFVCRQEPGCTCAVWRVADGTPHPGRPRTADKPARKATAKA